MSSAITYVGAWAIKPSSRLPVFIRTVINGAFSEENARSMQVAHRLSHRTYVNHMMYWDRTEFELFQNEVSEHLQKNDGWFESYYTQQIELSEHLFTEGARLRGIHWREHSLAELKNELHALVAKYQTLACAWYAQYPLDEFFEESLETCVSKKIQKEDPRFRNVIGTLSDVAQPTEVTRERRELLALFQFLEEEHEDYQALSEFGRTKIGAHVRTFGYLNRGLATSTPYTTEDIVSRLRQVQAQILEGASFDSMLSFVSEERRAREYSDAVTCVEPDKECMRIITQARAHSYLRNRRVEAFVRADYGASFLYAEIARRIHVPAEQILNLTLAEMFGALDGDSPPATHELEQRERDYAMVVHDLETTLITDSEDIAELAQSHRVGIEKQKQLKGAVASPGGVIRGRAKVCLDKAEIYKVHRGDILVAQFTTPDFVPAMEKAVAIVTDHGGISSHAAIISRELGVPCIVGVGTGTRVIKDNDLLEVNAQTGIVTIVE